jgi:RNA polymerase subunit RPABC4/transcription elongation factor Spt4
MAIIRCPYCHAIIDENDKYCNNCGTQLLFPEDESVEEEIPGEKIIDAEEDEEEKDYDLDEPGKTTTALLEENEEGETEEERTAEPVTGPAAESGSEGKPEEVILVDEIATQDAAAKEDEPGSTNVLPEEPESPPVRTVAPEEETRPYPARPTEKAGSEDETVELSPPQENHENVAAADTGPHEEKSAKPETEEVRTEEIDNGEDQGGAPVPPAVPATFDTRELDGMGKTVELGKDQVDRMIQVMAEKQKEASQAEASEPVPEKKTGTLPPWADRIKGAAGIVEGEETREAVGKEPTPRDNEEEELFPRRKPTDSGIGFPERVTQASLPFGAATRQEEEGAEEEEAAPEPAAEPVEPEGPARAEMQRPGREGAPVEAPEEKQPEFEEEAPRPPFQFSVFLKAKAFDFLFIGVFWLVALWVAARSMDATLFELLSVTSALALLLYLIFLGLYFFLFKFFLGETLGDRLFKERE